MNSNDIIHYQPLTAEYFDDAVKCISENFRNHEPLTAYLKVGEEEFRPFVADMAAQSLRSELGVIAIDAASQRLVGARLSTDAGNDFTPTIELSPKMTTIMKFLDCVSATLKQQTSQATGKYLHAQMMAVDANFHNRGIAKGILLQTALLGERLGYSSIVGEVTNRHNKRILSRSKGWHACHAVRYEDYQDGNQTPFVGITGHDDCTAFMLNIKEFLEDQNV